MPGAQREAPRRSVSRVGLDEDTVSLWRPQTVANERLFRESVRRGSISDEDLDGPMRLFRGSLQIFACIDSRQVHTVMVCLPHVPSVQSTETPYAVILLVP